MAARHTANQAVARATSRLTKDRLDKVAVHAPLASYLAEICIKEGRYQHGHVRQPMHVLLSDAARLNNADELDKALAGMTLRDGQAQAEVRIKEELEGKNLFDCVLKQETAPKKAAGRPKTVIRSR